MRGWGCLARFVPVSGPGYNRRVVGLSIVVLPQRFAVCRLSPAAPLPQLRDGARLWSVTRTEDELSLVLEEADVPAGATVETGWRCLMVLGPLDLNVTGVLSSLAGPLAEAGVSIFSLSTYDTDYLLVKEADLESARDALAAAGHSVG